MAQRGRDVYSDELHFAVTLEHIDGSHDDLLEPSFLVEHRDEPEASASRKNPDHIEHVCDLEVHVAHDGARRGSSRPRPRRTVAALPIEMRLALS